MRPFLAFPLLLLVGCADADAPAAEADTPPAASSATYTDAESFCEAVVTEAFVRAHFDVPADVPITQSASRFSCSGYWGAETEYDPAATQYTLVVAVDDSPDEAATRFANATRAASAAENRAAVGEALGEAAAEQDATGQAILGEAVGAVGGTAREPVADLGDEAVIVRPEGSASRVAFRRGAVVVTELGTWPVAWGREIDARAGEVEARGVAFARAIAERM